MTKLASFRLVSCVALLTACGGSPPSAFETDAGSPPGDAAVSLDDAAVVEPPDAAVAPDAWAAPGALGDSCDASRPCAPELICDGAFSRAPICALPPRTVPGVTVYLAHPYLAVVVGAPLASSDVASV